ncbi:MAG TPA: twin-arginine translocase TatA/TatE family subunit [Dehalococcoidales bacterium]|nr:twin-arginine translocase TatA/TatE family subunit [Dehalococcoidales bacterium]
MRLGWPEILLILAIVIIVFGVGKLPQVGAQLGRGIREFRKSMKGEGEETDTSKSSKAEETQVPKTTESAATQDRK